MASHQRLLFLIALAAFLGVAQARAANQVAGELIVFNDNGAWSWFEDERVLVDSACGKIVLSSVANLHGPGGARRGGDVDVVSYDLASRTTRRFTLSHNLQNDDHNSAALVILPDGRYLASYSKHASDNHLRYRVSVKPGDIAAWEPERVFVTAGGTTYSNLVYLSRSNTIFNFHRDGGRGFDPNYLLWKLDSAAGFTYGGRLLTGPEGNAGRRDRPYLRYVSNGADRIHFLATDHHPRDLISNGVYHGYLECKHDRYGVYRSDGTRLGDVSSCSTSPYQSSDFTALLNGNAISPANGLLMTRGWTIDIELDTAGCPYVVFKARVNDNDLDHRFFYGRYTRDGWKIHELAKAGGCLYSPENDYTGLAALDPNDPDHVFISTKIDPRSDSLLDHYEIFEGTTPDFGVSWTWWPVTYESSVDNLRPVIPRGTKVKTGLLWMRGIYNSYSNYSTRIVGLTKVDRRTPIVAAQNYEICSSATNIQSKLRLKPRHKLCRRTSNGIVRFRRILSLIICRGGCASDDREFTFPSRRLTCFKASKSFSLVGQLFMPDFLDKPVESDLHALAATKVKAFVFDAKAIGEGNNRTRRTCCLNDADVFDRIESLLCRLTVGPIRVDDRILAGDHSVTDAINVVSCQQFARHGIALSIKGGRKAAGDGQ